MDNIPYLATKITTTVILLLLTALFSYLPWLISARVKNSKRLMGYFNALAGGVVLGALLMHMIPEIINSHSHHGHGHGVSCNHAHNASNTWDVYHDMSRHKQKDDDHKDCGKHDHKDCEKHKDGDKHGGCDKHGHGKHKHGDKNKDKHKHDDHGHAHSHKQKQVWFETFQFGALSAGISFLLLFAVDRLFLTHSHCEEANVAPKHMEEAGCCDTEHPDDDHGSCHSADVIGGCHMDGINSAASKAQSIVFVMALSIHSFLEGLGMATKNTRDDLIMYLISLYAHKWLEAFALGVSVFKARFSTWHTVMLILLYSVLTPVGIVCGMILEYLMHANSHAWAHNVTGQVLNGLAVGSFLFVSCIEMIPPEFHKRTPDTPWKFLMLVAGFAAMAAISALHFH